MATIESATEIRPFTVEVPEEDLVDLRRRIASTRWPERETVADQPQGLAQPPRPLGGPAQQLGGQIQLGAERPAGPPRQPVVEMLNVIGPLSDPVAHGGDAEDAFDVVVPSMPGYGFSGKPSGTGWDPVHIAEAWIALMRRLGYTHFVAQGGDWGAQITDLIGAKAPPELLGIHSNMPGTFPPEVSKTLGSGEEPSGLSADESRAWQQLNFFFTKGIGYATEMNLRPQTLYGLADSPVALAAWMLDHDARSYGDIVRAFEGNPVGNLTRDEVLDKITLTWVTNTGMSSGRLYWENTLGFFDVKDVKVPAAISVCPHELYQAPRSWAEQAYPNLIYFNEVDEGNHFAAWQEPELFTQELRAAFRPLRTDNGNGVVHNAASGS